MKIWLPYIKGGSGTDVFTELLARGLTEAGHEAVTQQLAHHYQYAPWLLRGLPAPARTEVILANSWNGFALHRPAIPLVVVEHHCIFDPAYTPYRSAGQALFHETLVRSFEMRSFAAAAAVVAVSAYTARKVAEVFPGTDPQVILNGIDTEFFCPREAKIPPVAGQPFRLLFVGNLTERKGADLLPRIMTALGDDFELHYTRGLRARDPFPGIANMRPLGRLSAEELREAYRNADALLFPSRLEGFGYAAAEGMACGTPVVASRSSSLPEVITDGITGLLCPVNDVGTFADAIRSLAGDPERLTAMGVAAHEVAAARFSLPRMVSEYLDLFEAQLQQGRPFDAPVVP